jgi:signal transduction histidine kinase
MTGLAHKSDPGEAPFPKRRVLLRDALVVLALNCIVALGLTLFAQAAAPDAPMHARLRMLGVNLVFSQVIGLSIFGLIEALRLTWWWRRPPGLAAMSLATAAAIPVGYLLGGAAASLLTGVSVGLLLQVNPWVLGVELVTVAASLFALHFITQREHLAEQRRRAQAADAMATAARLQLLQQQIEPHMLFNTLANVHALIDDDPQRAQRMLEALSELLHASMQMNVQPMVSLKQEFGLIRHYLQLMSIRMGPRLSYSLSLPAALEGALLPPLLLQPLVENAIQHGLDSNVAGGEIRVEARREAGRGVVVAVSDNGPGLQGRDPFGSGRIGLNNVRRRLVFAFGDQAGLRVADGEASRGVLASVNFPEAP